MVSSTFYWPGNTRQHPLKLALHLPAAYLVWCRFFSSLVQRSAKVHRRLKGGSMTMLAILPGQPAKGERQPDGRGPQDYPNLTPEQREKLLAALQKRQPPKAALPPGSTRTEVDTYPLLHYMTLMLTVLSVSTLYTSQILF